MIKEAIDRILSLAVVERIEQDGRPYTSKAIHPILRPEPKTLGVNTLTGIRDYLAENKDGLDLDTLIVHVVSPREVRLFSGLCGEFEQRRAFVTSEHKMPEFEFGKYYDIESFVIAMQAFFVQDEMTANLLQLVGTITDDLITVYADDGVTQQVTAKTGIGRVEQRMVPNPVALSPYRTFLEVEQPSGRYLFRLKSGVASEKRPSAALFEADGGAWKLEAIRRIQYWLRLNVPESVAVIA